MRKRKRLLREKRSESDDDDSESEDEAPDIGRKLLKRKVPKTLSAQEQEEYRQTPPAKRRRHQCYQCPHFKKGGVRSYSSCHLCGNFICKAHSVQVCYPCATSVNNENPELDQARLSE